MYIIIILPHKQIIVYKIVQIYYYLGTTNRFFIIIRVISTVVEEKIEIFYRNFCFLPKVGLNNNLDIKTYSDRIEYYKYSSLGIYSGIRKYRSDMVDINFILDQLSKDSTKCTKALVYQELSIFLCNIVPRFWQSSLFFINI